jgi:hypothetical protein
VLLACTSDRVTGRSSAKGRLTPAFAVIAAFRCAVFPARNGPSYAINAALNHLVDEQVAGDSENLSDNAGLPA